jgi:hypothetical protein
VKIQRGDWILVAVLLLLGTAGWFTVHIIRAQNPPARIRISASGQEFELALRDTLLVIPGPLGETKVRVENKRVWIEDAPCPNRLCMRQGKISRPGESIICIPNRIVITIEGNPLDAITY